METDAHQRHYQLRPLRKSPVGSKPPSPVERGDQNTLGSERFSAGELRSTGSTLKS